MAKDLVLCAYIATKGLHFKNLLLVCFSLQPLFHVSKWFQFSQVGSYYPCKFIEWVDPQGINIYQRRINMSIKVYFIKFIWSWEDLLHPPFKYSTLREFLAVQCLGFIASTAGDSGLIPDYRIKIPHATWRGPPAKKKIPFPPLSFKWSIIYKNIKSLCCILETKTF